MNRTGRALAAAFVPMMSIAVVLIPGVAQAARSSDDTRVTGFGQLTTGTTPNTTTAQLSIRDVEGGLYHATGQVQLSDGAQQAVGRAYCVTGSATNSGYDVAAIGLHILRSTFTSGPAQNEDVVLYVTQPTGTTIGSVGFDNGPACPPDNFTLPASVTLTSLSSGHISVEIPANLTCTRGDGSSTSQDCNTDDNWNNGNGSYNNGAYNGPNDNGASNNGAFNNSADPNGADPNSDLTAQANGPRRR